MKKKLSKPPPSRNGSGTVHQCKFYGDGDKDSICKRTLYMRTLPDFFVPRNIMVSRCGYVFSNAIHSDWNVLELFVFNS